MTATNPATLKIEAVKMYFFIMVLDSKVKIFIVLFDKIIYLQQ